MIEQIPFSGTVVVSIITLMHIGTSPIQRSIFLIGVCTIYTFLLVNINTVRRSIKNSSIRNRDLEGEVEAENECINSDEEPNIRD